MSVAKHLTSRRQLGWTDLNVAPLALGTMQFGWTLSDVESMELLDAYVAAGGNFIDTADMYGPNQNWRSYERCKPHLGVSEDVIGRWMADRGNRDSLVVGTKVRAPMWDGPDGEGLSRKHIERAVEDSLRRLRTDVIDLYQAHWPDDVNPIEETFATFADLIKAGKVRYVGVSNYAALGQLDAVIDLSKSGIGPRLASEQPRYNLLNRSEYEGHLREVAQKEHLGVICYSPLASGFLTGKYSRDSSPEGMRKRYVGQYMNETGWALIDELDRVAIRHHVPKAPVALAWILAQPGITAAIAGANSTGQLHEWLAAGDLQLQPEEVSRLGALGWDASKPEYTSW
jgi:aryl-alcohol dehydrogenase-like predicted oxidoreductase